MSYRHWLILVVFGLLLIPVNIFVPDAVGEEISGGFGTIRIYPDCSTGIITQEQFIELESNYSGEVDVGLVFPDYVSNGDIWIWRNMSHTVSVPDYGMIQDSYTLVDIRDIEVVYNPEYVDLGDIPSGFYRSGTACYWDEHEAVWFNQSFIIGFDSIEWIVPGESARFYYEYYGVVGYHDEESFWFDWDNSIRNRFHMTLWNDKKVFYLREIIQARDYLFKINYDVPLNSGFNKFDLYAKRSSKPLGDWDLIIDPWYDSNWNYHKSLSISDNAASYHMKLVVEYNNNTDASANVSTNGKSNTNFSDLRFVIDNTTVCPYWVENKTDGQSITLYLNTTTLNPSSIELFYGNAGVGNTSDGDSTFIFFDDFEETVGTDASKWTAKAGTENGEVSDDFFVQGSRCVKVGHEGTSSVFHPTGGFDNPSDVRVLLWHYSTSTARDTTYIGMDERTAGGETEGGRTTFYSSGDVKVYDGAWKDTSIDYVVDTWYRVEKRFNDASDTFELYVDGVGSALNPHGYRNNIVDMNGIMISCAAAYPTAYADCVCVMKYVYGAEPHWDGFGSEVEYVSNAVPTLSGVSPVNQSTDISMELLKTAVVVSDGDGDTITCSFRSNASGNWILYGWNVSVASGTNISQWFGNATLYDEESWWCVNCTDGNDGGWVNATYFFTTEESGGGDMVIVNVRDSLGIAIAFVGVGGMFVVLFRRRKKTNLKD